MEDPTTMAMNLTFFATLGIGLVMFVGVFTAFVAILLLAGLGRLVATAGAALFRRRVPAVAPVRLTAASVNPGSPARPVRREPQLSPEWAAAVERADVRASARAKAAAAPEVKVSVREVPSPNTERKAS